MPRSKPAQATPRAIHSTRWAAGSGSIPFALCCSCQESPPPTPSPSWPATARCGRCSPSCCCTALSASSPAPPTAPPATGRWPGCSPSFTPSPIFSGTTPPQPNSTAAPSPTPSPSSGSICAGARQPAPRPTACSCCWPCSAASPWPTCSPSPLSCRRWRCSSCGNAPSCCARYGWESLCAQQPRCRCCRIFMSICVALRTRNGGGAATRTPKVGSGLLSAPRKGERSWPGAFSQAAAPSTEGSQP